MGQLADRQERKSMNAKLQSGKDTQTKKELGTVNGREAFTVEYFGGTVDRTFGDGRGQDARIVKMPERKYRLVSAYRVRVKDVTGKQYYRAPSNNWGEYGWAVKPANGQWDGESFIGIVALDWLREHGLIVGLPERLHKNVDRVPEAEIARLQAGYQKAHPTGKSANLTDSKPDK